MDRPIHWRLSAGVRHLERSVMRDLLALAVDPDIISFAGGLPPSESLPVAEYQACLDHVLARDGARALQYSPQYEPLRTWIAGHMQARGVPCAPEQIFLTNGAQQGLAILSRLFLDPGEPAAIEAITFTGVQQVTAGSGAIVRPVAIDPHEGVDVGAFEAALERKPHPRLAIVIPAFHNPLSASLSAEKRASLAAVAARYAVPLVEDDPYSALQFEGEPVPPIKAYDEAGFVFYLGSFSKMLAPAVRLGWIVAPSEFVPKVTVVRESFDLESSTLTQRAIAEFTDRGLLEPHLAGVRQLLRQRRDAMLEALDRHLRLPAQWTEPHGGLFVWLTLPEDIDSWQLFERAVERQVAYIPGSAFAVDGGQRNTIRLSFSNVTPARIDEGIGRLAAVLEGG
ncbi:MAG TPA: PLP-dependent aminotransferase family protein [Anaerolineales bacterium]|jgi:2-aminoadipate transaminase